MVDSDIQYFWWVQYPQYSAEVAKGATYIVEPRYEGLPIYAQITFTDDAGRREQVNSARTERVCAEGGEIESCQTQEPEDVTNAPIENTAAAGKPAISGTPAVGEILTADTSGIEDVNGLTNADFAFQWSRYDGSVSADIAGATGSSYTVTDDDVGYEIEVKVSFTDDAGFAETVTSDTVYVQPPQPLFGALRDGPENHDGSSAFTVELRFSDEVSLEFAAVRDHVLDITGGTVTALQPSDPDSERPNLRWQITITPSGDDAVNIVLPPTTDCTDAGAVCTDNGKMLSTRLELVIPGPSSEQSSEENSAATGLPAITGTVQVAETLTADTSGISDADGLTNATFSYQWLADDGNAYTDISGATSSTYTLLPSDEGKAFRVRVSFTDDAGNEETRTSALARSERPYGLNASESDGAVTLTWNLPVGWTGSTFQILRNRPELGEAEPLVHVRFTESGMTTYTDTDVEPGVLYVYRVKGVDPFGYTGEASHPFEVRTAGPTPVENSPATGAPVISGTVEVGETLTVNTSDISDADGLTGATFSYQWLADDSDISGATGHSYTLADADEGKAIRVRVAFTDDGGNDEALTSSATAAVETGPASHNRPHGLQAAAGTDAITLT